MMFWHFEWNKPNVQNTPIICLEATYIVGQDKKSYHILYTSMKSQGF